MKAPQDQQRLYIWLRVISFRVVFQILCVLAGCVGTICAAERLTTLPTLKQATLLRGDPVIIEIEAAAKPDKPPFVELTRDGQTIPLKAEYQQPAATAPTKITTIVATLLPTFSLGSYAVNLNWDGYRYGLKSIAIVPAGDTAVHLKQLDPSSTYDVKTAYIPDPADHTAEKLTVSDYSLDDVDRIKLASLRVTREKMIFGLGHWLRTV